MCEPDGVLFFRGEDEQYIDIKIFLISIAIIVFISSAIVYFSDMDWLLAIAITTLAILANGVIASCEDKLPGAINNPDSGERKQKTKLQIAVWIVFFLLLILFAYLSYQ